MGMTASASIAFGIDLGMEENIVFPESCYDEDGDLKEEFEDYWWLSLPDGVSVTSSGYLANGGILLIVPGSEHGVDWSETRSVTEVTRKGVSLEDTRKFKEGAAKLLEPLGLAVGEPDWLLMASYG